MIKMKKTEGDASPLPENWGIEAQRERMIPMKTFDIVLNSIVAAKNFVNIVNKYEFDVDLTSGRYVVDAK